jgi:peptidoglycan/LPS O-acetylase OafA/YrhL
MLLIIKGHLAMEYRREIDGLRALAVVPVVLFHAGFQAFSGGYVGVDIFFVISGYLITSIILTELSAGQFSLINFYERRARRILPALFFVMLVCLPFAWLWLLPTDLLDFSKSLIAVISFSSNILFWLSSGYFESASDLKPLLHTWSLAVEEQYYVLFPIVLMLIWRWARRSAGVVLSALLFASLCYAQIKVDANPSFAFFMLPTRGWELLMGALASLYIKKNNLIYNSKSLVNEVLSFLGLILISFSILNFNKNTSSPSLITLLPTLGTALIILFASPNNMAGKMLSSKLMVGLGLISYSTYLWHQPVLAMSRHAGMNEQSNFLLLGLAFLSILLGWFTWVLVEQPFRDRNIFCRKKIFIFAVAGSGFFLALGLIGVHFKGFESRLSSDQLNLLAYKSYSFKSIYESDKCFFQDPINVKKVDSECFSGAATNGILLIGDSHAAALSPGITEVYPNVARLTASGCFPSVQPNVNWLPQCDGINQLIAGAIRNSTYKEILLHANWILYAKNNWEDEINNTISYIKNNSPSSKITLIGGVPQFPNGLPKLMVHAKQKVENGVMMPSQAYMDIKAVDQKLKQIADERGIDFHSVINQLCDKSGNCLAVAIYKNEIMPIIWDYGHLTMGGSQMIAKNIPLHSNN